MAHLTFAPEVLDLKLIKHQIASFVDERQLFDARTLDMLMERLPEQMAYRLTASMRLPTDVLQDNRVIHRHPATLWDHIKQRVAARLPRLKPYLPVRYTEIRLNEHLIYPNVRVPEPYADRVRLYTYPDFATVVQ